MATSKVLVSIKLNVNDSISNDPCSTAVDFCRKRICEGLDPSVAKNIPITAELIRDNDEVGFPDTPIVRATIHVGEGKFSQVDNLDQIATRGL